MFLQEFLHVAPEGFAVHGFLNASIRRWSGDAMVLGKLSVPGRPTILMTVEQGPIVLAADAGGGWFGLFYSPPSFLSSFSLSLGDGPIQTEILSQRAVKPKPTNQPTNSASIRGSCQAAQKR